MAKKKKTKARRRGVSVLRFRKNDPTHNLYAAVQHYVRANHGSILVIGGVEVQEWPGDAIGKYRIAIRCLGQKPIFPTTAPKAEVG